jgi:hypothetical protein
MIKIGEVVVEEKVFHEHFVCDLQQCHGACCTIPGGRGAPLRDDEVDVILDALPVVKKYLPAEHLTVIEFQGGVDGSPGNFATTCLNHRACVFVYYEGKTAKCSFERAYLNGELTWRKPLSCHLFPLRVNEFESTIVEYEPIGECFPGKVNGRIKGISLGEFLEEPLRKAFGQEWISNFKNISKKSSKQNSQE